MWRVVRGLKLSITEAQTLGLPNTCPKHSWREPIWHIINGHFHCVVCAYNLRKLNMYDRRAVAHFPINNESPLQTFTRAINEEE